MTPSGARLAGMIVWTETARYPAMRDFYRDVLRLPTLAEREWSINFAWDELRLTVTIHHRVSGPSLDPERIMINFAVEDLDTFHSRLIGVGAPCIRPPEREHWGGRIATFADPDGNIVQLLEL